MDTSKNYYDILGVDENASISEIKSAFKNLSKKHHPDKGGNEEKFKKINEAYNVLSDENKKEKYDMLRSGNGFRSEKKSWNRGGDPFSDGGIGFDFNFDTSGFKGEGGMSIDDIFNEFVNQRRKKRKKAQKTIRRHVKINLSWEETKNGCKKIIKDYNNEMEIEFPAGVPEGFTVPINEEQNFWAIASPSLPPGYFQRKGNDIYKKVKIDTFRCVIGTKLRFENPYNEQLEVKIPPKTENGAQFLVQNEGIKYKEDQGDIIIVVDQKMPDLNEEQIKMLNKLLIQFNEED